MSVEYIKVDKSPIKLYFSFGCGTIGSMLKFYSEQNFKQKSKMTYKVALARGKQDILAYINSGWSLFHQKKNLVESFIPK